MASIGPYLATSIGNLMTKVLPVFELPIGATVERGNVNAKAELFSLL